MRTEKVCPSCSYTGDTEFTTCPRCGLILSKYRIANHQGRTMTSTSANELVGSSVGKSLLAGCGLLMLAIALVVYLLNRHAPRTGSHNSAPSETASIGSTVKTSTAAVPSNSSNSSADTLPNNLGIAIQSVNFASDVDAQNMPVNDLTKVPFGGRKVVVRVKMVIPPEKTYQFTGKFYDGEGKLVMNVTSPSTPTLSVWHAWYYHNLDRADDKPGTWKFVFLVNDEPVLEKAVEVAD